MPPHDPHRGEEGQRVRVAAGLAAGLVHQASQGEVRQQQAVELLLGEVRRASGLGRVGGRRSGVGQARFAARARPGVLGAYGVAPEGDTTLDR